MEKNWLTMSGHEMIFPEVTEDNMHSVLTEMQQVDWSKGNGGDSPRYPMDRIVSVLKLWITELKTKPDNMIRLVCNMASILKTLDTRLMSEGLLQHLGSTVCLYAIAKDEREKTLTLLKVDSWFRDIIQKSFESNGDVK